MNSVEGRGMSRHANPSAWVSGVYGLIALHTRKNGKSQRLNKLRWQ